MKFGGQKFIFGAIPDLPVAPPVGTLKYKIRGRSGQFARIFIKTEHGVSEHFLVVEDGKLVPGIAKGSNLTQIHPNA